MRRGVTIRYSQYDRPHLRPSDFLHIAFLFLCLFFFLSFSSPPSTPFPWLWPYIWSVSSPIGSIADLLLNLLGLFWLRGRPDFFRLPLGSIAGPIAQHITIPNHSCLIQPNQPTLLFFLPESSLSSLPSGQFLSAIFKIVPVATLPISCNLISTILAFLFSLIFVATVHAQKYA